MTFAYSQNGTSIAWGLDHSRSISVIHSTHKMYTQNNITNIFFKLSPIIQIKSFPVLTSFTFIYCQWMSNWKAVYISMRIDFESTQFSEISYYFASLIISFFVISVKQSRLFLDITNKETIDCNKCYIYFLYADFTKIYICFL